MLTKKSPTDPFPQSEIETILGLLDAETIALGRPLVFTTKSPHREVRAFRFS